MFRALYNAHSYMILFKAEFLQYYVNKYISTGVDNKSNQTITHRI